MVEKIKNDDTGKAFAEGASYLGMPPENLALLDIRWCNVMHLESPIQR